MRVRVRVRWVLVLLRRVLSSRAAVRVASCAVVFCGLAARLSAIFVERSHVHVTSVVGVFVAMSVSRSSVPSAAFAQHRLVQALAGAPHNDRELLQALLWCKAMVEPKRFQRDGFGFTIIEVSELPETTADVGGAPTHSRRARARRQRRHAN